VYLLLPKKTNEETVFFLKKNSTPLFEPVDLTRLYTAHPLPVKILFLAEGKSRKSQLFLTAEKKRREKKKSKGSPFLFFFFFFFKKYFFPLPG
jgi:hypothetical protein